jgi:hypothetical protein
VVIAAGVFAMLGPAAAGAGEWVPGNENASGSKAVSKWKTAAQQEAVR